MEERRSAALGVKAAPETRLYVTLYGGAPPGTRQYVDFVWRRTAFGMNSAPGTRLNVDFTRRSAAFFVNAAPGTRLYVDFVWRRAAPPLSV